MKVTMDEKEFQIEFEKNQIERDKLEFEKIKFKGSNKFVAKNFGLLITSIISIATVFVSYIQFQKAQSSKELELEISETNLRISEMEGERRYKFDVTKFIMDNGDKIFEGTSEQQERTKNIMLVAFPPEINEQIFANIKATKSDEESQNIWEKGEVQADKLAERQTFEILRDGESIQYYIDLLQSPNRDIRQEASKILIRKKERQVVINMLIDNLKPDGERASYRNNFYIAFTLYKMPEKWASDEARINKVMDLRKSTNYSDYHFKKYIELAIKNMK